MSLPTLLDRTFVTTINRLFGENIPVNSHRLIIKSPNPKIANNPGALPINPSNITLSAPTPTRTDYLTPGGTSSNFGITAPGKLSLSGSTGRQGKLVWERLLDFYGRSQEDHVFYIRDIEISWENVLYIGSWDDLGLTQDAPRH